MYILCKANEVFMVGVDVRNLDINQQQHLLGETADQKKKRWVRLKSETEKNGEKETFVFLHILSIFLT